MYVLLSGNLFFEVSSVNVNLLLLCITVPSPLGADCVYSLCTASGSCVTFSGKRQILRSLLMFCAKKKEKNNNNNKNQTPHLIALHSVFLKKSKMMEQEGNLRILHHCLSGQLVASRTKPFLNPPAHQPYL